MKALIVEPSRFFASVLSGMLLKHGFEADIVASGEAGLEALAAQPYELLCFAFSLGDMNGNDFFLKAKMNSLVGHFPSYMISSGLDPQQRQLAQTIGISDCLQKSDMAATEKLIETMARHAQEKLHGRILLVEDSEVAAAHCKDVLVRMGLTVDHFKTAEEAHRALLLRQYDLVITDFLLEGEQTGLWLVRKLRESKGENSAIPVLAISGFEEPTRKIDILRAGANDFVAKPVLTEELELRVRNLFKTQMLLRRLEIQFQHMRELALHDQLTGLFNRHYIDQRIPELFAQCDQQGRNLVLIAIDIDHFKQINDNHGHHVGDHVLEAVAQVIQESGRKDAIAARLGGEEFMLLQPDLDLVRGAMRAEGMRHRLETLRPAGLRVTASMGVVQRNKGEAFDQLMQRADKLVYAAKQQGRNQVMAG
jgi:two-component system cell cycle response regulator